MPEYLSPGVYVEEVDSGAKPIEGVSTSTTGMVGVTERGPVGPPILVTSFPEFERWFGGRLNADLFAGDHNYLPHAVEGFFTNGGKRLYIVRVFDTGTNGNWQMHSRFNLHDRGDGADPTHLLRTARELSGDAAAPMYILDPPAWAGGESVRVGDGSDAEYHVINALGAAHHAELSFPLSHTHASAPTVPATSEVVHEIDRGAAAGANFTLADDVDAGDNRIRVQLTGPGDLADVAAGAFVEIGSVLVAEHRRVRAQGPFDATTNQVDLTLQNPLVQGYESGNDLFPIDVTVGPVASSTVNLDAEAGNPVAYLDPATVFTTRDRLIVFQDADGNAQEVRRKSDLGRFQLATATYDDYPSGSAVAGVTFADTGAARALTEDVDAGTNVIALNNRSGLDAGDVIRIGVAPDDEYVTILEMPDRLASGDDPGLVVLEHGLGGAHVAAVEVFEQTVALDTARPSGAVLLGEESGQDEIDVTDAGDGGAGSLHSMNDGVRFTTPAGAVFYHRLEADATALNPRPVSLTAPLTRNHSTGSVVVEREALVQVFALDPGGWGRRLRISVEDETDGLATSGVVGLPISANTIRVDSLAGIEPGTVLELLTHDTEATAGPLMKVQSIDRVASTVTLANNLDPDHQNAIAAADAAGPAAVAAVRSREFRLAVRLMRQPDPAVPSRDNTVIDTEVFRHLSMDHRHSRYVEQIIGARDGEIRVSDRRPEGQSRYVRVQDTAPDDATRESIRLGPETLTDTSPIGVVTAARHTLAGGGDSVATLTDAHYIGNDSREPDERTGLAALKNIEEISLIAAPGRTSTAMQNALINQCELMRYRFAVLDSPVPPADTLVDMQRHRQRYDTKYASLYYPWLTIPDPYPRTLDEPPQDFWVPPSGHMLGVYARTDVERGVHKAPANEVVRGIRGLRRSLNKSEHDMLNPVNINVIRDFRPNNRGIRAWGGRVITSDSDWKYVNVRRLLIFIEASIDKGTQWVVFEPNAEPLWARVRRTISNFLTVVWRNGALEGTTPEEAFFVKCDRTTMTQTDIDNGRLICEIGVAPVKPAEFVIFRIGLWTAHGEE